MIISHINSGCLRPGYLWDKPGRYVERLMPHSLKKVVAAAGVMLILLWCASPAAGRADDTPVATGDGFVVTKGDVQELSSYVENVGFTSTPKQHIVVAVRTRVFAEEAKALGLDQTIAKAEEDKVVRMVRLSMSYIRNVLDYYYSPDDIVIESYYLAHPEQFEDPLDDTLKQKIGKIIAGANRMKIMTDEFERLKEKYHVRILYAGEEDST